VAIESLNVAPLKKRPALESTVASETVDLTLLVPTLEAVCRESLIVPTATEPSLDIADSSSANPTLDHVSGRMSVDECAPKAEVIPQVQAAVADVYDDEILGDLDERFDPSKCRMATDADVQAYSSRVVVLMDQVEHILDHGKLDYYLIDDLKNRLHSFENGTKLSDPQKTPVVG